jgi:hypothetical protein
VIAASIADPVVECASNAGWFGPGNFTDRSNLDVGPALAIGLAILVLFLLGRARSLLAGIELPRRIAGLLPSIFALQLASLFVMETTEQLAVRGHLLGPAIWLGGPILASLTIHALFCTAVTLCLARSARRLAATTLRVIAMIAAIARIAAQAPNVLAPRPIAELWLEDLSPLLCRIGERAPPLPQA